MALATSLISPLVLCFAMIIPPLFLSQNPFSFEAIALIRTEGEWVISTIKDTGRGIDVEELEHVVKRFYRADKSHSRQIQGTGLGLPLVNSIVEAYGGKFRIESRGIGHGTTVSVYWKALKNGDSPI
jgi:signal transduction histidine kinase